MKTKLALAFLFAVSTLIGAELNITWNDNSDNEDGFLLERSINGTSFLLIDTLPPDAEETTDIGLSPSTEYWYRIRAFNAAGNSGYSNIASATTQADLQPPSAPSGTTVNLVLSGNLSNISTRGLVEVDQDIIIGGFVVANAPLRVLIRGVGPTLANFGIQAPLADPQITLLTQDGTILLSNDNWSGQDVADAAAQVGAFALPAGSKDSAILVTLPPGAYTVRLSGVAGGSGTALLEIYEVP